jgi:hypothetical protein
VPGQDTRGNVAAAHCELPACRQVADALIKGDMRDAPTAKALDEVRHELDMLA